MRVDHAIDAYQFVDTLVYINSRCEAQPAHLLVRDFIISLVLIFAGIGKVQVVGNLSLYFQCDLFFVVVHLLRTDIKDIVLHFFEVPDRK